MSQVISYKSTKMGPIAIDYHVNTICSKFNWTYKDCPQMRTTYGLYNGVIKMKYIFKKIEDILDIEYLRIGML